MMPKIEAPNAPCWFSAEEANAWEQGWTSGAEAYGRAVAEACAVQAWNTGMDLHSSGKAVMDTREAGSKCAAAIREAAKEIK